MADETDRFDAWLTFRLKAVGKRAEIAAPPPPLYRPSHRLRVLSLIAASSAAAVASAAVVAVALLAHHTPAPAGGQGSTVTTIVPWRDLPAAARPGQARPFTVVGVTACKAADLNVQVHVADPSYVGAGPLNTAFWTIDVRDVATRPCFVGPTPDVSFYTAAGPLAIPKGQPWSGNIVYLAPGAAPAPPFFGSASGEIDVGPCLLQSVSHLSVDFGAEQGSVVVLPGLAGGFGTACPVAHESYFTELYGVANGGGTMGYAPSTQTTIDAPSSARAGQHLSFLITLEKSPTIHSSSLFRPTPNPAMSLQPCPTFHDEIEGVVGTFHTYQLNCGSATAIPSGGRETFAMEVDIPADAQPGPATLIWSIDGAPALFQTGHSYLPIVP